MLTVAVTVCLCTLRAEEGEVRGGAGSWSEQGRADNSRAAGRQGSQVTSAHKQDNQRISIFLL